MKKLNCRQRFLGILLTFAIITALCMPVLPVAAANPVTTGVTVVWGANSVTIDSTAWSALKAIDGNYVTVNGTYGTYTFSYSGIPVYVLLQQITGVSSLSGYSALVEDNSSPSTYQVLVGPNVGDNISVKNNNSLIVADSGTVNGSNDTSKLLRLVCPYFSGGNPNTGMASSVGSYYNQNVAKITLVYSISITSSSNGSISLPGYTWNTSKTTLWNSSTSSGGIYILNGGSQTINFTPTAGYIASYSIDNGSVVPASSYTFTNMNANHTLSVNFVSSPTFITVIAGGQSVPISAYIFSGLPHNTFTVEYTGKSVSANLTSDVAAGSNTLQVASINGFNSGETLSLKDSQNSENVTISSISAYTANPLTITLTGNLTHGYTVAHGAQLSSANAFHTYSGVPVYQLMSYVDSGLTTTNYDIKATGSGSYTSLVGPTLPASEPETISIEGNNNLIIADSNESGPLPAGIIACSTWAAGKYFNHDLISLELVYTVSLTSGSNGTVSPKNSSTNISETGVIPVSLNGTQTFTFTPSAGYTASYSIDNGAVVPASSYTFTNMNANHTLSVNFVSSPTFITVIAGGQSVPISAYIFSGLPHNTFTVEYTGKSVSANLTSDVAAGSNTLQVASINGFNSGETLSLKDSQNSENVTISSISAYTANPLTITLTGNLTHGYTVAHGAQLSSANAFHTYSGVPVYQLMSYVNSGLTTTNYDIKATGSGSYVSLVGPTSTSSSGQKCGDRRQ